MGETHSLARFVMETELRDVPDDVRARAKTAIRDFLGVAVAGTDTPVGERIVSYVDATAGGGESTVFCRGTASAPGAALANGTAGHALDYDDTFETIVLHPTAPVFSAALAVGESTAADEDAPTGEDLLRAYVLGVEVASRVGHATYPRHYDNGWHCTGTIGSFGAAAAATVLLDTDVDTVAHAFGIVGSLSSALKKNFGSMTKPLHAGHAASMGVRAALLAAEGFTADEAILDGPLGYGAVMTPGDGYDPAVVTAGFGEDWAVADVGFKPYPSGVITHAAMEAARDLRAEHDLAPADVARVVVSLDEAANEMLHHRRPQNALQAKFSIEFCLAAVLREGDVGVREFSDAYVTAPETEALVERVERDFEDDLFDGGFAGYGARVVVETTDGARYETERRYAPGSPSHPLSDQRLRAKFTEAAGSVLPAADVDALEDAVSGLDDPGSLDALRGVLRPDA